MNRFILGFGLALLLAAGIWFFLDKRESQEEIRSSSALIQQQLQQVGKLIVIEGQYSEVFTFKNSRKFYLDMFSSEKKALVVVNAKATVEYDLRQLVTEIDEANKTVIIKQIPNPVLNIYPDIEYYDVTQDYFNKFEAKDYNKIKNNVTQQIRQKIEASALMENAQDRLMSELANIFILTKSMGWTLMYEEKIIEQPEQMLNLQH
jgi:lysophospholipase L1-like esterase